MEDTPEFIESDYDSDNEMQYSDFMPYTNFQSNKVEIDAVVVSCGNVWQAAKLACILYSLHCGDIKFEEAMQEIDNFELKLKK